jgi:NAD(P)-dependent dehydrogenase (short-subunit alcohol dehydrogenase family)
LQVTELGGEGIAVQCDHGNDVDVQKLVQRVIREKGRIDVLVNNAFAAPEDGTKTSQPFWEQKWVCSAHHRTRHDTHTTHATHTTAHDGTHGTHD